MLKYFLDFCCEKKNKRFFFFLTILRYAAMTFILKNNIKKRLGHAWF
jgi:hypothetical protein